ncbi:hypothetical protein IC620_10120 [Hazenella sp. IB182357]|uniref:Barstar (barnase inhibitor) domain-containing protein n=1 Tax=Polycladospora coralii TaxID=2771432 RepID=A0A926N9L4_9BACL|nr:hypothetical protein [Polycladospora coralii]MBD1372711.1 hypothetical protein [Polycladospora coralii]
MYGSFDEAINDELEWEGYKGFILYIVNYWDFLQYENYPVISEKLKNAAVGWNAGRNDDPNYPTPPMPFHIILHCDPGDEEELIKKMKDGVWQNMRYFIGKILSVRDSGPAFILP